MDRKELPYVIHQSKEKICSHHHPQDEHMILTEIAADEVSVQLQEIFKLFICGITTSSEYPVKGLLERYKVKGMV